MFKILNISKEKVATKIACKLILRVKNELNPIPR